MTTTSINIIDAKEDFSELINRVYHHKERYILTRRDKEVAVIIPLEDFALLQSSQDKHDLQEAVEALKEARIQGTMTLEELENKINQG